MFFSLISGFGWGLLEGTWFFVIPDILLSLIAIYSFKNSMLSTVAVIVGAMVAALILYSGLNYSEGTRDFLLNFWSHLPGFYPKMFQVIDGHLTSSGPKGITLGPTSGIPYRFYILEAFRLKLPLSELLYWTPWARLLRIIIAPLAAGAISLIGQRIIAKKFPHIKKEKFQKVLAIIVCLYWVGIYIWYWGFFLPETYG
jgi:hypothetical protein